MNIEHKDDWPVDSTRFLLPTVAIRGFPDGPRSITLAWWTWRVTIHMPRCAAAPRDRDALLGGGADLTGRRVETLGDAWTITGRAEYGRWRIERTEAGENRRWTIGAYISGRVLPDDGPCYVRLLPDEGAPAAGDSMREKCERETR